MSEQHYQWDNSRVDHQGIVLVLLAAVLASALGVVIIATLAWRPSAAAGPGLIDRDGLGAGLMAAVAGL